MRSIHCAGPALSVFVLLAARTTAQQAPIPIRPLGQIVAVSQEMLASISAVRPLSDGRVLVNDQRGLRVVLFDSTLTHFTTVADTTSGTAKAYGKRPGGLFPYSGDSSVFADPTSLSLLVVDPGGVIVRTIAAPLGPGGGLGYLVAPARRATADGVGSVVYLGPTATSSRPLQLAGLAATQPIGQPVTLLVDDSAPILRSNLVTRAIDTVAMVMTPANSVLAVLLAPGDWSATPLRTPMAIADDWAVMADGTIAIVRERDYHIDWIARDGTRTSSPKIQHEWERITDVRKAELIDSARSVDSGAAARATPAASNASTARVQRFATTPPITLTYAAAQYDASVIPDYRPPFVVANDSTGAGAARGDADGNLWIRVNQIRSLPGGPVFDIVNRHGTLVDRVQIPGGTAIVGFGPGIVYLGSREGPGYLLARARIR